MTHFRQSVVFAVFATLLGTPVWAAPTTPDKNQSAGAASAQTVPEDRAMSGGSNEPLSDKLDRSGGVIRPPSSIDPGMMQAPPATSRKSTPVIPPPGAKPGVNPK
ncbi:MAG: hypothetical protein JO162_04810 [Alphaproteobacteria bacterium]|nr:hypothetical protein [Alphaproteobacteria bacterium]MBV9015099.1 hypothetical protein [Alphaproteobacteria bacterium]MBV9152871.1 hypothetical protein [Alphaproteobacteria bacterium]MBV9584084.1 hypothetical protein [Alphaproteobacteria bacterium]MBV9965264.1 hypothetical protein [Alphaproteobacteria bacterium]